MDPFQSQSVLLRDLYRFIENHRRTPGSLRDRLHPIDRPKERVNQNLLKSHLRAPVHFGVKNTYFIALCRYNMLFY